MAHYKLLDELGQGGMGVVYRALQEPLGRQVAIKFLLEDIRSNPELIKRFQREVEVSIHLSHPNIIKILDAGELDGRYFYAMEFLSEATPLDKLIKVEGPFPEARALDVTLQLLDALEYLHGKNILHRDIKPANVMVGRVGHVTLMDFGLVKDVDTHTLITADGKMIGTPRYMSPEQVRCLALGPEADLWAVGVILYEMLTLKHAFLGDMVVQITRNILKNDPVPPSTINADLSPDVDALVAPFLLKEIDQRVRSAREGAELIRRYRERPHPTLSASGAHERHASSAARRSRPVVPSRTGATGARSTPATSGSAPALESGASSGSGAAPASAGSTPRPTAGTPARPRKPRSRRGLPVQGVVAATALAVMTGAALFVLSRPAPRPVKPVATPSPSASVARPLTVDRVRWEGRTDRAIVTFASSHAAALVVEAQTSTGELPAAVVRETARETRHEAILTGLVPGTSYRLRILDDAGNELWARDEATPTIAGIASLAVRALEALDPQGLALRIGRSLAAARDASRAGTIRRWDESLRERLRDNRVEEAAEALRPLRDRIFATRDVPAADRARLFALASELSRLEELAFRLGIKIGSLSERFLSSEYGQIPAPRIAAPSGVVLVLESGTTHRGELHLSEPFLAIAPEARPRDVFSSAADTLDPDVPPATRSFYVHPRPLPLPARLDPERLEIHAVFDRTPPGAGVRVLVSGSPDSPRPAWRPVAFLRSRRTERHAVYHSIPPDVMRDRPIYLRVEIAYAWSRAIVEGQTEQEVCVPWLLLGYSPPEARSGG